MSKETNLTKRRAGPLRKIWKDSLNWQIEQAISLNRREEDDETTKSDSKGKNSVQHVQA